MHLNDERGFTMVTFMGVLFVVVAIVFTTYAIADGDLGPGKNDEDRKIAYAAAEAGVENYMFHLIQNDDYWASCTNVAAPHAINQRWDGTGTDTRTKWLNVPGSTASYAIELLPANGASACVPGDTDSMLDQATRTLRIRATGRTIAGPTGVKRSIVATLRRQSFLDYLYFTDLETPPPAVYSAYTSGRPTLENQRPGAPAPPRRNIVQWSTETCGRYFYAGRRTATPFRGDAANSAGELVSAGWRDFSWFCQGVNFFGPTSPSDGDQDPDTSEIDTINGPLHTNDEIRVCGHPRFGRSPQDKIEISGPGRPLTGTETPASVGWRVNIACPGSAPNVNFPGETQAKLGTWLTNAPTLTLPASNAALRGDADPAYRFRGRTIVKLDGTRMTVSGTLEDGTVYDQDDVELPADGVLYVSNRSCGAAYEPTPVVTTPPAPGSGCGDLEVEGNYSVSITLGAENDIIVKEDIIRDPDADVLLGLVSNNFIRIWHPVSNFAATEAPFVDPTCTTDASGPGSDMRIDGVILSVANSFLQDYWYCGGPSGTLTINGAVAQKYRGNVSLKPNVGTLAHGYSKNYVYDDRLRFRSPPHFIDPVKAGWQTQAYVEQIPAR